jgi:DNA-binding XRE family transcriptional regulator
MKLRNNVQKYRVWKGLTQAELAKKAGCSVLTIQNVERHVRFPHFKTQVKLLRFFDLDYQQLFYIEE